MDAKKFWNKKHLDYASTDWIDKPTLFAQFLVSYFPKSGKLLDLGAGQGQDSRYFARKGYEVTAADFSNSALKFLKEKSGKEKLNIVIKILDLSEKIPFQDNFFNVVYSHLALHYFDDNTTKKVFGEIYRVLKKGGIFATLTNTMGDPEVIDLEKIGEGYYKAPDIYKRFFTIEYMKVLTKGKFKSLVLDSKGETHKDEIKTLIRFVGKKL